jgi:hypothetical protein
MVAELRNALNNRDYEIRDVPTSRRFIDLVLTPLMRAARLMPDVLGGK